MTRLLSLVLFMLLSVFMTVAFAGDTETTMEGTDTAPKMCMDCMHTALMCEVCGPKVMCQECQDHMASCELCKTGAHETCPWVAEKMATGCAACAANMMANIPCADCAKGMIICKNCAPMFLCEAHQAAMSTCADCKDSKTLCVACQGAMFMCDACMAKIVCNEHRDMMRACEKCSTGQDCDECMNASLACEACHALHMPPAAEGEVAADVTTSTDASTTTANS